jgi:hypothetical protein
VNWLISALTGAGGFITARWYDLHSRQFPNTLKQNRVKINPV